MKMRLDKLLSESTGESRAQVKKWVRQGCVQIDGQEIVKPETKVDADCQEVLLNGKPIIYEKYIYIMLNKPSGVVSATKDNLDQTVIDLLNEEKRDDLFPVGRLDKDTVGLLLITNDGDLAHRLLSPKKHVDKTYLATISGKFEETDIARIEEGIDIGEAKPTLPGRVESYKLQGEQSLVELTIHEGKYHQVKRMFAALDKPVVALERIRMGSLQLDPDLKPGQYRRLTKEEVTKLKQMEN